MYCQPVIYKISDSLVLRHCSELAKQMYFETFSPLRYKSRVGRWGSCVCVSKVYEMLYIKVHLILGKTLEESGRLGSRVRDSTQVRVSGVTRHGHPRRDGVPTSDMEWSTNVFFPGTLREIGLMRTEGGRVD